jgi:CRISPR-associated endonuclease/helicase Cas3
MTVSVKILPICLRGLQLTRVTVKDIPEYKGAVTAFFNTRMSEAELDNLFSLATEEVIQLVHKYKENGLKPIALSLIIKYIFSCLIDADRTNTREFEEGAVGEQAESFDRRGFFQQSYSRLMEEINKLSVGQDANHPINQLRSEMSRQCEEFAVHPSGDRIPFLAQET